MAELSETKKFKIKTGQEITLRTPRPSDGANLLETVKVIFTESEFLLMEPEEFTYTVEQESETLRKALEDPKQIWIIPEVDGKIIGCFSFSAGRRRRIAHAGSFGISILKEYRGLGIGRRVLEAFLEWARSQTGLEIVDLEVVSKNAKARRLYESLGFRETGRKTRGIKYSNGSYDDLISMALML